MHIIELKNKKEINIVLRRDDVRDDANALFGDLPPSKVRKEIEKEINKIKEVDGPVPDYLTVRTEKFNSTVYVLLKNGKFVKIGPIIEKVFFEGNELYRCLRNEFDFVKLVKLLRERDYVSLVYVIEELESSMAADVVCCVNTSRSDTTISDLAWSIQTALREEGLIGPEEHYPEIMEFVGDVIDFI